MTDPNTSLCDIISSRIKSTTMSSSWSMYHQKKTSESLHEILTSGSVQTFTKRTRLHAKIEIDVKQSLVFSRGRASKINDFGHHVIAKGRVNLLRFNHATDQESIEVTFDYGRLVLQESIKLFIPYIVTLYEHLID